MDTAMATDANAWSEGRGAALVQADLAHVVHPLSPLHELAQQGALMIVAGSGCRIRDAAGKSYLDACAGLWNVNVGYGREELADVARDSLASLGYATLYLGRGNEPAALLAAKLSTITPPAIDRFFYTVGGSDANETAIKIARYRYAVRGKPGKVKVIARRGSYHGSSFGAVTATGAPGFWEGFGPLVPGFSHIDQPERAKPSCASELEDEILRQGADTVAAFIAEPISVPCGLPLPPDGYWQDVREICDHHDVTLILDEVITGFGRTGRMFGSEHWQLTPDLLVLAKGLTSGYLPLGAVGMSDALHDEIAVPGRTFMHGFTAGGHPACCAVALRNVEIIEEERLVERAAENGEYLLAGLRQAARDHPAVTEPRGLGMMAAFDLVGGGGPSDRFDDRSPGKAVELAMIDRGILVRAFGDTVAMAPPLVATRAEIDEIVEALDAVVPA